ncbi:MAG: LLM class flavin-dependent oxidoreductase, partial [Actinobacteria bacterium]|nr:LLM class flavin-dependent oxidoreductase [Actinomycetota bacterium]
GMGRATVRVGLTLPSFQTDPERVLTVARAAEDACLDGVFLFDHLFRRRGDATGAERRPALELMTMTAAVAAGTDRITVGTLVARATLRPPGMHRAAFDTLERIAPGRIVAGLGGGDDESIAEDEAFGVLPADPPPGGAGKATDDVGAYRLDRLAATVETLAGRPYPVWVAAVSPAAVRLAAGRADGWNRWGGGPPAFGAALDRVRAEVANAGRDPGGFTYTWGGLAVLAATPADAAAKRDRLNGNRPGIISGDPPQVAEQIAAYAAVGADWVILGPIDSADPSNAALLGDAARLIRSPAR